MRRAVFIIVLAACTSAPGKKKQSGGVTLTTWEYQSSPSQVGEAFARFYATEFPELISSSDPCELERLEGAIPNDAFDAGLITIAGTRPGLTLAPDMYSHYTEIHQMQTLFSGGEPLTITASGGEVPAFTEQLTAPSQITITTPPAPTGDLIIPVAQDFMVGWTGGNGLVQVALGNLGGGDLVVCRFQASAGSGVIPQAMLAQLDNGAGATFTIDSVGFARTYLGDWRVEVTATFSGMWPNDTIAFGNVQFQ